MKRETKKTAVKTPQVKNILPAVSNMWAEDQASRALGMEIVSAHPGHAELTMLVRADMINGHGTCHGGLIFSLADSAFALACNSYNFKAVASGVRIDFLQPTVLGDRLNAVAEQISQGRRVGVYDVMVSDQKGSAIALFRGNSYRLDDE